MIICPITLFQIIPGIVATEAAAKEGIAVSDEENCVGEEEEEEEEKEEEEEEEVQPTCCCGRAGWSKPINTQNVQQLHISSYLSYTKVLGKQHTVFAVEQHTALTNLSECT